MSHLFGSNLFWKQDDHPRLKSPGLTF